MANFGGADRLLTGAHAVEKVAHVIVARVEPHGRRGQRRCEKLGVAGFDLAARDEDPAVAPLKVSARSNVSAAGISPSIIVI